MGVPLFEQVGKRIHLTRAGDELQRYGRSIAQLLSEADQVFEEIKGLQRGHVCITVASTANYFVPRLWATRRRPWVDRLASAWLIRRFIDANAAFLWLESPADCPAEALGFALDLADIPQGLDTWRWLAGGQGDLTFRAGRIEL